MHRVRMAVTENVLSDASLISHEDYQQHLVELGCGWVVEENQKILGFAIGRLTDANIWALFVAPGSEGRGIGGQLHDVMISHMFSAGQTQLWLSTTPGTRAERFYSQRGWQYWPPHPAEEVRMILQKT